MLGNRLRRWSNIGLTIGRCLVLAGHGVIHNLEAGGYVANFVLFERDPFSN